MSSAAHARKREKGSPVLYVGPGTVVEKINHASTTKKLEKTSKTTTGAARSVWIMMGRADWTVLFAGISLNDHGTSCGHVVDFQPLARVRAYWGTWLVMMVLLS